MSKKAATKKIALTTIADELTRFDDLPSARTSLSFACGSAMDVSGKVRKLVCRDGCKLVIEPETSTDLIVFADCRSDAENIKARKVRKGSPVSIRGKFQTFGREAVCLSDCRLTQNDK